MRNILSNSTGYAGYADLIVGPVFVSERDTEGKEMGLSFKIIIVLTGVSLMRKTGSINYPTASCNETTAAPGNFTFTLSRIFPLTTQINIEVASAHFATSTERV